jgi:NAD(P)H-quinone oxidoreductase subunit N
MPLLLTGRGFRQQLEGREPWPCYAPLEGGAETRCCDDSGLPVIAPR